MIHPWDAALDDAEWRSWLADGHDFGLLAVNGRPGEAPVVVPTHFVLDGEQLLIHLARPNPVWASLEADPNVTLTVVGDYAYVPPTWRAKVGDRPQDGVPTSYYAAVQLTGRAEIVDEPAAKADLLTRQLAHFQPDGDHAAVAVDAAPYGRLLPGIRGLRVQVSGVRAKFKYDDNKPAQLRRGVAERLVGRGAGQDAGAAAQQRRRLDRVGTWRADPTR